MDYFNLILLLLSVVNLCYINNAKARLINEGMVGGYEANLGEFSYMTSIQENTIHVCGGGIISDTIVLTAAHCFLDETNNFKLAEYSVVAGTVDLLGPPISMDRVAIEKVSIPVEFKLFRIKPANIKYREKADIAVVKLKRKLTSSYPKITYLNLPSKNQATSLYSTYENENSIIAGFGAGDVEVKRDEHGAIVEIPKFCNFKLKYAQALVLSHEACSSIFNKPGAISIFYSHLCAKLEQSNPCKGQGVGIGDSGGPLVVKNNIVIGIASSGPVGCDERKHPSVYTRVSYYRDLLDNAINDVLSPNIRTHKYN